MKSGGKDKMSVQQRAASKRNRTNREQDAVKDEARPFGLLPLSFFIFFKNWDVTTFRGCQRGGGTTQQ